MRSASLNWARSSISPPRATRNSAPDPGLTTWPGSTLRSRTRPAAGERMSSRPMRGTGFGEARLGTRTRAFAASRAARLRSSRPSKRSLGRPATGCAHIHSAPARRRRERPAPGQPAAAPSAPEPRSMTARSGRPGPIGPAGPEQPHHAALACDADRHIDAGRQRSGRGDRARDLGPPRDDHGHGRHLSAARTSTGPPAGLFLAAA